jgi:3-dehydroquinate synthetase
MIAASAISEKLLGFAHTESVVSTVETMGLPTRASGLDLTRVLDLTGRDKKRDAGGLRMVLLEDIEKPVMRHVDQSDVEHGLTAIGF